MHLYLIVRQTWSWSEFEPGEELGEHRMELGFQYKILCVCVCVRARVHVHVAKEVYSILIKLTKLFWRREKDIRKASIMNVTTAACA